MKYTRRLLVALLTFIIGCFIAAVGSAHLGKRVWSPRVFAWRNPLRKTPAIELSTDSPLLISNPRYYSFVSLGAAVGGVLHFDITNRSNKQVHSYHCRYYSSEPFGNGAYGSQPEKGLLPGQSLDQSISAHEYAPLTLTIDFVQFRDGTTWFSNSPQSTVKPDGLRAGANAAADYLLRLMTQEGTQTAIERLPRIHADVREPTIPANNPEFGILGFYCGVTNIAVRVEREYEEGGPQRVEAFLRSYQK